MTMGHIRIFVAVAVTVFTSGVSQVVAAALDDECCVEACDGSLDGKHCPPNCTGPCAKVSPSLGAVVAPCLGPRPTSGHDVVVANALPHLPLVVAGVFHPPIA